MEEASEAPPPLGEEAERRLCSRLRQLRAQDETTARSAFDLLEKEGGWGASLTLGRVKLLWTRVKGDAAAAAAAASAPAPVSVASLRPWPRGRSVRDSLDKGESSIFSVAEKLKSAMRNDLQPADTPSFQWRESLLLLGEMYDRNGDATARGFVLVQDTSDSVGVLLLLKGVHEQAPHSPVFEVEWHLGSRGEPSALEAHGCITALLREGRKCALTIKVYREEMTQFWLPELRRNQAAGAACAHPSLRRSALAAPPLAAKPLAAGHAVVNNRPGPRVCATCEGTGLHACSACRSVHYCSAACQARDWKRHKKECQTASKPDGESVVLSAIQPLIPGFLESASGVFSSFSSSGGEDSTVRNADGVPPVNPHGSKQFVVKVQIQLLCMGNPAMGLRRDAPLCMYDEGKVLMRWVGSSEAAHGPLVKASEKHGLLGGAKVYLRARREGTDIRVFLTNPPVQRALAAKW